MTVSGAARPLRAAAVIASVSRRSDLDCGQRCRLSLASRILQAVRRERVVGLELQRLEP